MIGTLIGATVIVVVTALFIQERVAFLATLAVWGAVCAFAATVLRNFASYASALGACPSSRTRSKIEEWFSLRPIHHPPSTARHYSDRLLAGYTAIIVAADTLGATGGPNTDVFMLAVNADSFWVDGYFEETNLAPIRVGDPAQVKLMGYSQVLHGRVDSIARAINVSNAQPNGQGVATVNPIFTWVRLAQRIPVRIHLDQVPPDVVLAAGMTVTVQIDPRRADQGDALSRE
jgi:fusaric acid resistance family protein/HlyD family secretion protein